METKLFHSALKTISDDLIERSEVMENKAKSLEGSDRIEAMAAANALLKVANDYRAMVNK